MGLQSEIILHPAAIHFAVSGTFNPTGSYVVMDLTIDQRVNITATASGSKLQRTEQTNH